MELGLILIGLVPLLLVVLAVVKYKRLQAERAEREAMLKTRLEAIMAQSKKTEIQRDRERQVYRQDLERAERERKTSAPIVAKPVTPFSATSDTRTMSTSYNDTNDIASAMLINNMFNNSPMSAVAASVPSYSDDTPRSSYTSSYSSSSSDSSYSSSSSDSSYSSSSSDSSSFSSD